MIVTATVTLKCNCLMHSDIRNEIFILLFLLLILVVVGLFLLLLLLFVIFRLYLGNLVVTKNDLTAKTNQKSFFADGRDNKI